MSTVETKQPTSGDVAFIPRTALVVANLETLTTLCELFKAQNWEAEYAPDNVAALQMVKHKGYHLIITDQSTSAVEDIELLRKIRAMRPHVRMIILTDDGTPSDVIDALREHAFSYFHSPFSVDSLNDMVRLAMETPSWDDGLELLSATPSWVSLLARADQGTADRMVQFFVEMIELPDIERGNVAFAFREMLLNAVRHGAHFDPSQFVEISYVRARHMIACRVKDPGEGFTFAELYHAALSNPAHDPTRHVSYRDAKGLPPGGYGILLSQHMVDELLYNEKGNEVMLVKYLPAATASSDEPLIRSAGTS